MVTPNWLAFGPGRYTNDFLTIALACIAEDIAQSDDRYAEAMQS